MSGCRQVRPYRRVDVQGLVDARQSRACFLLGATGPFLVLPRAPHTVHVTCRGVASMYDEPASLSLARVQFTADVMKPLNIEALMDQEVQNLSGGELQRVAITLCLGQPADIYLIDEPSAYLDSEQRIIAAKVRGAEGCARRRLCRK